jgi:hypothetical protein
VSAPADKESLQSVVKGKRFIYIGNPDVTRRQGPAHARATLSRFGTGVVFNVTY